MKGEASLISVLQPERPADATCNVGAENRVVRPYIITVTKRRVKGSSLPVRSTPCLRIVTAAFDFRQLFQVATFRIDAQEHVYAVTREPVRTVIGGP